MLFNHDRDEVIGKITKAWIDNGRGMATIEFDSDEASEVIYQKVKGGTLKGVSAGYLVDDWEEVMPNKTSTDGRFMGPCSIAKKWAPYEISIVSVPADPTVGVGREMEEKSEPGTQDIPLDIYERQLQINKNRITDTVEGTGVLGEIEDPVTGQFSSATIKIPFAVLYSDMFSIVNTTEPPLLTLRGSMQCTDPKTGATGYYPIRVVVRGKAKTTTLGKVAKGKKMESEVELEILYIKVEINNAVVLELDKLNFVFVLNGKDMLAQIRSQC